MACPAALIAQNMDFVFPRRAARHSPDPNTQIFVARLQQGSAAGSICMNRRRRIIYYSVFVPRRWRACFVWQWWTASRI